TGEALLTTNGGLIVSSESRTSRTHVEGFFANTVRAAERFDIAHELHNASEQCAETTHADGVVRDVSYAEISAMYETYVSPNFAGLGRRCVRSAVCLFTVTPDFGFVIDWLPGARRILVASPCSGHGFKHSATVGEILAELTTEGKSRF